MSRWGRAAAVVALSTGALGLSGCGDSAPERAAQLKSDLQGVQGVASVETSTPSTGLSRAVEAEVTLSGDLDRAAYERVAQAYQDFRDDDSKGIFGSEAQVSVISGEDSAQVPRESDDLPRAAGYVERLSGEGDPVTGFELLWSTRPRMSVMTDDPMATMRSLATGDRALQGGGDHPVRLTTTTSGTDGDLDLEVELGTPGIGGLLDEVEQARGALESSDLSPVLRLRDDALTVEIGGGGTSRGVTPQRVLDTHDDVARAVCPDVTLTTTNGASRIFGCVDTQPMHTALDGLGDVEPTSLRNRDRDRDRLTIALGSPDDLASAATADLGDGDVVLSSGTGTNGTVSVGGTASQRSRLAPLALAAHAPGLHVTAGSASEHDGVDLAIRGRLGNPQTTFRAMRDAGWEGDVVLGYRSFGRDRSELRWRSSATGPAVDIGPLDGDADGKRISDQSQRIIDAWDASAG
ncbi:hypothetical protein [Janibacter melonis]|uniref:hypothetical protein n=1 Tax=Janibacter melonis TaxID=262209 RepID=UPI001748C7CE|nr:hypothetical protein [Janibacter melonis]